MTTTENLHVAHGVTLTEKEFAVLQSLACNQYGDGGSEVWSFAINLSEKPSGLTGKTLAGVVASICKKGLYKTADYGGPNGSYLGRTRLGDEVVKALFR